MTLNQYLVTGQLPSILNSMPDYQDTSFTNMVKMFWGMKELISTDKAEIKNDLEIVSFEVHMEYQAKITNYTTLIDNYLKDEAKEIYTGDDTTTRTPELKTVTEGKAAPKGATNFESAYSTGGSITMDNGSDTTTLSHGLTITREGVGDFTPEKIDYYLKNIHNLYEEALGRFGVLFEAGVA